MLLKLSSVVGVLIYGTSNFIRSQNGKITSILISSSLAYYLGKKINLINRLLQRNSDFVAFLTKKEICLNCLTQVLVAQDIIAVVGNGFDLMFSITTDRKNETLLIFQDVQIETFGVNFEYALLEAISDVDFLQ